MFLFHFTSSERVGIIALLSISITIIFILNSLNPEIQNTIPQIRNKKLTSNHFRKYQTRPKNGHTKNYTFFVFDPNTLPFDGFIKMGLSEKQATVIMRYRAKGGKFKTASDFAKIYSISDEDHKAFKPYIKIDTTLFPREKKWHVFHKQIMTQDLNISTEDDLIKLPHIGCSRAHTIIAFREKLGGYFSVDQLYELYGFTHELVDSIKPLFTIDSVNHKRININTASFSEMKSHPYFKFFTTKKIIDYRKIKGVISTPSELLYNKIIDSITYHKISNYISVK